MIVNLLEKREDIGRNNRSRVLSEVLFHGPLSRSHIADRVGLTQATVSRITRQLIDTGLIIEDETVVQRGPGRRFVGLKVRPNGCFVAGISINAFRQDVVVADLANAEVASRNLALKNLDNGCEVLGNAARELQELICETGVDQDRLLACGITVTGAIDPENGLVRSAPVLGWQKIDIFRAVQPWLDAPVYVDNIPNAKNLAAHGFGPARGMSNVVLMNVSLAIGTSLMLDGRLLRGRQFNAGLIDRLLISEERSWELTPIDDIAGGFGVIRGLASSGQASGQNAARTLVTIMQRSNSGDAVASESLFRAGRNLGLALAHIDALLHPELFLLSGPLIDSEAYCRGVRERCQSLLGAEFATKRLRCVPVSNQEAACAMAIFRLLEHGEVAGRKSARAEIKT